MASLKDEQGHIQYEKVFEFLLPDFEGEGYYNWIAVRVRNYMTHLIQTRGYILTYFKPEDDIVVLCDHIACFFLGTYCQHATLISVDPGYVVRTGDPVHHCHDRGEHAMRGM